MAQNAVALRKSLTCKFVAVAFLISLIPQAFLYFYSTKTASDMLIESLGDDLKEKSFLVGADIDRFYSQREHDVRILSQADVLEGDDLNAIIKYLTEIIEETPYLDDIDVINSDGIIIASSGEQNEKGMHVLELYPSLKSLFDDVRNAEQGEIIVSGLVELDSGPGLAFLTPITDDTNTVVIKILLVEINLDTVKKIVADFDDRVIGAKYVYLVNNDGRVIVSADPETDFLSPYPDLTVKPELLDNFSLQGDVGSVIYQDAKGEEVMAGFADMAEFGVNKAMDWSIIAVAPIADITKPIDGFKADLLFFTVIVFGMVMFGMLVTSRNILKSIQKLSTAAAKFGHGDFSARAVVRTKDEIGALAISFNQMAESLTSNVERRQRAEDDLKILNADLERRIGDRTAELREAQGELLRKSRLAALGQLTGTVSHELRNPLGALRAAIAAIRKLASDGQEIMQRSIAIADRSVTRCDEIISDLLDYSRVRPLNRTEVALDDWLPTVLDEIELPAGVELALSRDCGLELPLDPDRLRRVLLNLVDNACQAMTAGEEEDDEARARRLAVSTRATDARVELCIADTGPGFDAETLAKVFEPLYSSKTFGVGLGLTVVKQIMEQHGGGVEIDSTPGEGTEVVLWLPLPESARKAVS